MSNFPIIASILSDKKLGEYVKEKYGLRGKIQCKLFRTGVNHTYFLFAGNHKYAVRVYCYKWRTKTEIQEELRLLQLLSEKNLSVSFPISDKEGKLIQDIDAPEGVRHVVLFSFAEGEKIRFMDDETCFIMGSLMARFHSITLDKTINRTNYNSELLLKTPYKLLAQFFSEDLPEMKYLKNTGGEISKTFKKLEDSVIPKGIVHLDVWYDNVSIKKNKEITIFDFDNCGNGFLILDIGYFLIQLFHIESDKKVYESKVETFLNGYREVRELSEQETEFIPAAGASIFIFYLGVQAQRFDWSNIFLTENYLKMFVGRIKSWMDYYKSL
ncbi:phosphotransferase [Muricauda sp. 334s03]|uniref:Phosphotransferase n=1 Tax=Flagellimonas yonaguniensis TaxID=3031325 RepID=A0ABT5Y486_9FLAO|nr:phosphotransferase [[Muricauda] yonaguniensis]MDF0718263.1 phosphotransferase [[Muricauda] yonaguniensis]